MNKPFFTCILLLFFTLISNSPGYSQVKWGTSQKSLGANYFPGIVGESESHIFVTSRVGKVYPPPRYFIESFKKVSFERSFSKDINNLTIDRNPCKLEKIILVDSRFIVIVSYVDFQKNNLIYAFQYNAETGEEITPPLKVGEIKNQNWLGMSEIRVLSSPNKEKILINHQHWNGKKKAFLNKFFLLDKDLKLILDRDLEEVSQSENRRQNLYLLDDEGSLYTLELSKDVEGGSRVLLVSYDANLDYERWEETISPEDMESNTLQKKLKNYSIGLNPEGEVFLIGYFSEYGTHKIDPKEKEDKYWMNEGIYFQLFDKESKESKIKKVERYPKEMVDLFEDEWDIKKGYHPRLPFFERKKILYKEDGGFVVFHEGYTRTSDDDYWEIYRSVLVSNHDKEGNVLWTSAFFKNQQAEKASQNDRYFYSFIPRLGTDDLKVIYYDSPKNPLENNSYKEIKTLKSIGKGVPVEVNINMSDGSIKKQPLKGANDSALPIRCNGGYYQDSPSSVTYLFSVDGRDMRMGYWK